MVGAGDAVDIGRSILVGVALDQIRVRSRPVLAGLGMVGTLTIRLAQSPPATVF